MAYPIQMFEHLQPVTIKKNVNSLAFIDPDIEDCQRLATELKQSVDAIVLERHHHRLDQITETLQKYQQHHYPIDAIYLFSHGSPGSIDLGDRSLNLFNLETVADQLKQWQVPEIFLYACQVAAEPGVRFVKKLSQLTNAKIAAATGLVGNRKRGGSWDLSFSTGIMKHGLNLPQTVTEHYQGILATLVVTNNNDNGAGSLRNAIATASTGDTILFDSSLANRTITLTSGQIEIDKNLIVDGSNATGLTLSGDRTSRIFDVTKNADGSEIDLTIRNLIFIDGQTTETGEDGAGGAIRTSGRTILTVENSEFNNNVASGEGGGAIFSGFRSKTTVINSTFDNNDGTPDRKERGGGAIAIKSESELIVRDSEFTNNKGTNGGAINSLLSKLTVDNSTFINNEAITPTTKTPFFGLGGAILTDGGSAFIDDNIGGEIIIRNSHFEGNQAFEGGGANLFAYPPDKVIVEDSSFVNNSAIIHNNDGGNGGGIWHGNSEMSIINTTFANNTAENQGGGFWVDRQSPMTIQNSTFSGNQAGDLSAQQGLGGGLVLNSDSTLINNTIANNVAGFLAGGIFTGEAQPTINLKNTLFVENTAGNNPRFNQHTNRELNDLGGNIQWPAKFTDNSQDVNATASITIADPLLGPLQDNGNGQLTHALLAGSPAIDGGVNDGAVTTDQLGQTRPIDGDENGSAIADSGAYEFQGSVPETSELSDLCVEIPTPAVTENIVEETVTGTEFDEEVLGTDLAEEFLALGGADFFRGLSGNDNLFGGDGDDTLNGNQDNDFLDGEAGNDLVHGGKNDDVLFGNIGNDRLFGDLGSDLVFGGEGADFINGNVGDDFLDGEAGNDTVYGGKNNDVVKGNIGSDILFGDLGNDTVLGGEDDDTLQGNQGSDLLCGDLGNDTLYGGQENDTLIGGSGDDFLSGDLGDDTVMGDLGADTFVLQRNRGSDTIVDFELGVDTIALGGGLTFDQLTISVDANNSLIQVDDLLLATVTGVDLSAIAEQDAFISLI